MICRFSHSRVEARSADATAGAGRPQPGRSPTAPAAGLDAGQRRQLAPSAKEALPAGTLRRHYTATPTEIWSEYSLINIQTKDTMGQQHRNAD